MLKELFDAVKQIVTIADDTKRNRAEIKELREKYHELTLLVHKLMAMVERNESNEKHEREKLVLQLQNTLLQYEKRLPPASQ